MFSCSLGIPDILSFAIGAGAGLILTRSARGLAQKYGFTDSPDGHRKLQAGSVPVAGGVATLLAAVLGVVVTVACCPEIVVAMSADLRRYVSLLVAAVFLTTVGVVDDRRNLRARHKLLGQVAAALILVFGGGYLIERISMFGLVVEFGTLAVPVTVLWFLVCVNALNLIDGMDGLLGTVGLIALITVAVIALMAGHMAAAVIAFALAGAVLGFLFFNLPPATIYMGDAGSMLIGLVIGALGISATLKGPATVALITPVAILTLPMLDTSAAVIRRKLTGRGLATTDRGHLHHVLLRNGMTIPRVLLLVATLGLVASSGALASAALNHDGYALVAAAGVVATLLVTKLFGHTEFHLIRRWVSRSLRGAVGLTDTRTSQEMTVRLQGSADWESIWADLCAAAEELNLQGIGMDVNAPAFHENYHARWNRAGRAAPETHQWRVEIPFLFRGHLLGRMAIAGCREEGVAIGEKLRVVTGIIESAEARMTAMTSPMAVADRDDAAAVTPLADESETHRHGQPLLGRA